MASCCCWELYRWLSRILVYWYLPSMADTRPQRRRLTEQHRQQPVTTPRPPSTTPPRHRIITLQRTLLLPTTLRLPSITLLLAATPWPPNNTLPWATHLQLMRPRFTQLLLTTQRLLHPSTLNRNTAPRFQVTTTQSTPLATTLKLLFTTPPMHPSIIPLLTLGSTTSKLRSITLPRITTPLRHLNITPQSSLLQLTAKRLLNPRSEIFVLLNYVQICRSHFIS